jgi:hypothetical protein
LHGGKALPTDSIARERRGITRYWRVLIVKKTIKGKLYEYQKGIIEYLRNFKRQ